MAANVKGRGSASSIAGKLGKLRGSATEARERFLSDEAQRQAAGQATHSVILDPRSLEGNYDAARMLYTTLHGELRPITADDLAAFRHNIKTAQNRFKGGGIKARQVLDLSLLEDLERARKEIKFAVPAGFSRGVLRIITDAGGTTPGVTRHHMQVQFPLFDVAVVDAKKTPEQAARWLLKQPLKYDCDCGRHRFWYRYIATIGGFNAGRAETGFPKIRNPGLYGVGCKHALRAMSELESSRTFLNLMTKAIEKARDESVTRKDVQVHQNEAEEASNSKMRDIQTSSDRKAKNDADKVRREARRAASAPKAKDNPPASAKPIKMTETQRKVLEAAQSLGLSQEQIDKLVSAARK